MGVRWLAAFAVLAGCSGDDPGAAREAICVPRAGDDVLFAQLSAQRWGACGSNLGLCLELGADGGYRSVRGEGDYQVSKQGRWNFLARDAASGLVCLDDGSVIDFALTPDGLRWGLTGVLAPRDPLGRSGTRDELPTLLPVAELFVLTAHRWAKTNQLDLHMHPTELALRTDGTFDATFRAGECTTAGTFSLVVMDHGLELNPRADDASCGNLGASNEMPRIDGGELRLYGASYRDASVVTDEQSLAFSAYGDDAGLLVHARWRGPLATGAPIHIDFTLGNPTTRTQTVTSIQLTLTPVVATANGFSTAGPAVSVLDRALHEVIAPGDALVTSGDVELAGSGLVMLEVDISSNDELQRYLNQRHFIFTLDSR